MNRAPRRSRRPPACAVRHPAYWRENLQFGFQAQQYDLRKAVRQMKGHMLRHVGAFKVGEISAAVRPGSAILLNGVLQTANREIGVPGGFQILEGFAEEAGGAAGAVVDALA